MSSKTKIVVLHMKEIIYTSVFLILGVLLIFLLFYMFRSDKIFSTSSPIYQPGVYTSTISLSNATLSVEVSVDETSIQSVRFSNLDDAVIASYPLVQPAMEQLALQLYETQSTEKLTYPEDNQYTSLVIIDAIETALSKAKLN